METFTKEIRQIGASFASCNYEKVDQLENLLKVLGIRIKRYDRDMNIRENIQKYMDELVKLDVIIVMIDEAFFQSKFCLYELASLIKYPDKLLPVYKGQCEDSLQFIENLKTYDFFRSIGASTSFDWLEMELRKYDWEDILERLSGIFRNKYFTLHELFRESGIKSIIQILQYTPETYLHKLNLILEEENFWKREEEFEKYLEYGAATDLFYYKKAISYEREGYWNGELYYLRKAIQSNETFLPAYEKEFELVINERASIDEIERDLDRISRMPEDLTGEIRALYLHTKALMDFEKAKKAEDPEQLWKQADRMLDQALALKADQAIVYNNKGQVKELLGEITEAAQCYEKAIGLNHEYYQAYNNLALLYAKYLKDNETAIKFYNRALKYNPEYIHALNGLAIASENTDIRLSLKTYLELICLHTETTDPITNAALILEEDMNCPEVAGVLYEIIWEKKPQSVVACFNYANYLRRNGGAAEFIQTLLDKVRKLMPESDIVIMTYALLYFREDDFEKCKEELDILSQICPDYAPAKLLKGVVHLFIEHIDKQRILKSAESDKREMQDPGFKDFIGYLYYLNGEEEKAETVYKNTKEDTLFPVYHDRQAEDFSYYMKYLEKTYLRESTDRIYKTRPTKLLLGSADFKILEEIKNNINALLDNEA